MAVPIDLLDPPALMSYGGLVDPSTAEGQVDEEADWCGAVAALLTVGVAQGRTQVRIRRPYAHPLSERRRKQTP
ncbi:MAG TPA: hypothetical protein VH498_04750 [Candidatus Dormibacteraeota bacterium]|nr:hypothetical protein [Candidatus Dormibacteraeota bacterium]